MKSFLGFIIFLVFCLAYAVVVLAIIYLLFGGIVQLISLDNVLSILQYLT